MKTLHWIHDHSAGEIADQMAKDYDVGDKALDVKGLVGGKATFTSDGRMPAERPETVPKVLSSFSRDLKGRTVALSETDTDSYVDRAQTAAK